MRYLFLLMQMILFLAVFFVGSLLVHPFGVQTTLASGTGGVRLFQWDGVLLMLIVYAVVLGLEAVRKRLRSYAVGTTVSLLIAAGLGLWMKFGFVTLDR